MAKPIFEKKNILVVGGAGFIGSHLCDELVREHKVICVDNFLTGSERNIDHLLQDPNFEFVRHDITMPLELAERESGLEKFKVAWQGVQEIYYLASPTAHGDVEQYPIETLLANSVGLANVLALAKQNDARLLYASSDAVYGDLVAQQQRVPETELGVIDYTGPRSAYTEGKRFGEALIAGYRRKFGLNVRVARLFNTYGPRMRLSDTRLVVKFFQAAITNAPMQVFGGADTVGSYCYVTDTVKALIRVMEQGNEQPVNIGQDQEVKLVDLAKSMIALTGSSSSVEVVDALPEGYRRQLIPDIRKAKEELGWFPITLVDEGLQHTVDYLKASKNLIDVRGTSEVA